MSAEYPSVPARVLRERGYASVSAPAYVTASSGTAGRAEHAEAEQPGSLPYHRRRTDPDALPRLVYAG